jgi:hypothetical protein
VMTRCNSGGNSLPRVKARPLGHSAGEPS